MTDNERPYCARLPCSSNSRRRVFINSAAAILLAATQGAGAEEVRAEEPDEPTLPGAFSFKVDGRLHADMARVDDGEDRADGTVEEWRRARLGVSGKFLEDWRYRYVYDFAAEPDFAVKDAYIGYYGFEDFRLRVGNLQQPQSLEELTSSNAITFMERALPNALVRGYSLGAVLQENVSDWHATLGVFEGHIRDREEGHEGWAVAARVARMFGTAGRFVHLGASAEYREPSAARTVRFSSRPEIHLADERLVSTGTLSDVDHTFTSGVEWVAQSGPWSVQAEYLRTAVERDGRADVTFDGWYIFGSWFVHGGTRNYDGANGTFDPVRPGNPWGAWELAVRYSTLDLQDGPITGGQEYNWTVGLNWYLNRRIRVMLNWVEARGRPDGDGNDRDLSALQARFQYHF